MGFLIHSTDDGHVPSFEYLPCGAITPQIGMALTQTDGNLAIATGATAPTYISMVEKEAACTAGDIIPVIRVDKRIIFETTNNAEFTSINKGDKVTLHTDGMQVTATTESGVAEVVDFDETAVGSKIKVRF